MKQNKHGLPQLSAITEGNATDPSAQQFCWGQSESQIKSKTPVWSNRKANDQSRFEDPDLAGDMRLTEVSPAFWKPILLSRVFASSWHGARSWAAEQRAAKRQKSLQNFRHPSGAAVTKRIRDWKVTSWRSSKKRTWHELLLEVWLTEPQGVRGSEGEEMKDRMSIFFFFKVFRGLTVLGR